MPERIGKYEVRGELGRGGMGRVYLGFDPTIPRYVAIKVLSAGGDSTDLARFRTEAAAAGSLNHKNIVTIYEFGEDQGTFYLAMQYLQGRDLEHVMRDGNALTMIEKIRIMSQVAEGLQCAHQSGIVHRDVKPANIMLLADGTVKIMDFGIARVTRDSAARLTKNGFLIGTAPYMAPEQLNGREADALCDIWAFGTIYYELISGQYPFEAADPTAVMFRIVQAEPPRLGSVVPECPKALDQVVTRLLSKDRDSRYQSLEDVLFDTAPIMLQLESFQAAGLVSEARDLLRLGKLDESESLIKRILALNPMHQEGRALRHELQTESRRRSIRARVQSLTEQAEKSAASRDFSGALQAMESALRIDRDNAALAARLTELRAAKERFDRARLLLTRAREDLERKNLTGAFQAASDAVGAEPGNLEAQQLLSVIQERLSERDAERRLLDGFAKVKGLIALQSFEEAIGLLEELRREAAGSQPLNELLERTRQQHDDYNHQNLIRAEIDAAKRAIKGRDFEAAVARLEPLAGEPSCKREVSELLAYAQGEREAAEHARRIEEIGGQARAQLVAADYEAALASVEAGLHAYPENVSLNKLRRAIVAARDQEYQRQAVRNCLRESAALAGEDQLQESCELLERTLRLYPGNAELKAALDAARKKQSQQRERARLAALQANLERAERLFDQGELSSAAEFAQELLSSFPGEKAVESLLGRIQAEVQRRVGLEAIYAEIRPFLETQQLGRATEIIARGKQQFGADPQLAELEAEAKRRAARTEGLELARQAFEKQNWRVAAGALHAILAHDNSDAEAQALLTKVQAEELAQQRRQQRENGRKNARAFLEKLRFDDAIRCLSGLRDEFPQDAQIRADLQDALDAEERYLRREAQARGRRKIDSLMRSGRLDEAIQEIERLISEFPQDNGLRDDLKAAFEAKREKDRRELYAIQRQKAAELVKTRKFDEAAGVLRTLLSDFQNDSQLLEDLKSALGAKELFERREALDRAVEQLEKLYRKGDASGLKEKTRLLPPDLLEDARIRELKEWAEHEAARQAQDRARESADSLRSRRRKRMLWVGAGAALLAAGALILLIPRHRPVPAVPAERLSASPEQLSFTLRIGDARSSQALSVLSKSKPVTWSASVTADWLSVSPRDGVTPADLKVFVDSSGLTPAVYYGQVIFSGPDGAVLLRANVTALIQPPPAPAFEVNAKRSAPSLPPPQAVPQPPVKPPQTADPIQAPPAEATPKPIPSPAPEIVNCHVPTYNGPRRGYFSWAGVLPPHTEQVIRKDDPRTKGIRLQGCDDAVITPPSGVVVVEQPASADGFLSVKIRNETNAPISGIELFWREK